MQLKFKRLMSRSEGWLLRWSIIMMDDFIYNVGCGGSVKHFTIKFHITWNGIINLFFSYETHVDDNNDIHCRTDRCVFNFYYSRSRTNIISYKPKRLDYSFASARSMMKSRKGCSQRIVQRRWPSFKPALIYTLSISFCHDQMSLRHS